MQSCLQRACQESWELGNLRLPLMVTRVVPRSPSTAPSGWAPDAFHLRHLPPAKTSWVPSPLAALLSLKLVLSGVHAIPSLAVWWKGFSGEGFPVHKKQHTGFQRNRLRWNVVTKKKSTFKKQVWRGITCVSLLMDCLTRAARRLTKTVFLR